MIKTTYKAHLKEGQILQIVPMGDIHYNTKECDRDRFHRAVNWCKTRVKKGDELALIGMGDYNDTFSPSERAGIASSNRGYGLHETSLEFLDDKAREMSETIGEVFRPLSGYAAGLLDGHHFMVFSGVAPKGLRGRSNTELLCSILSNERRTCPYLGKLGWITIDCGDDQFLQVLAGHGYGGARTPGARIIKRVRMTEVGRADLFLMGHDNEKMAKASQVLDFVGSKYISRKQVFCGTGSFQRAYLLGAEGGYVEELLLPPADLGLTITTVKKEKRNGRWRLDWHTSI